MIRLFIVILTIGLSLPNTLHAQSERVSENEANLEGLFVEANREKLLGRLEQAITKFQEVLKLDAQNDATCYELARIYDLNNDSENAFKYVNQAIAINKKNKWYKMLLADLYEKIGKDKEAAELYKQLVDTEEFDENLYYQLAYYLVRAGDTDKALKVYDNLEKKIGVEEELTRRKHAIYLATGDTKRAGKELQKLANANPENIDYQRLLAEFMEQQGDIAGAQAANKRILALDPNDSKANLALLGTQKANSDILYLNNLKELFQKPNVAIDAKVKELIPYINKVAQFRDPALADACIELAKILENTHPQDAKCYALYGDLLYHSAKPDEALAKYQSALKLNKNIYAVWEQLLYIQLETGRYSEMATSSTEVMDLFPNQATPFLLNGIANAGLDKHNDALTSLEEAVLVAAKNNNTKLSALAALSFSKSALKQYDKAKETAQKALALDATHPASQAAMGWAAAKMGDNAAAKEWFEKAISDKGAKDNYVLERYADWLSLNGENSKAQQYWQKARELGNKSPALEKKISAGKL